MQKWMFGFCPTLWKGQNQNNTRETTKTQLVRFLFWLLFFFFLFSFFAKQNKTQHNTTTKRTKQVVCDLYPTKQPFGMGCLPSRPDVLSSSLHKSSHNMYTNVHTPIRTPLILSQDQCNHVQMLAHQYFETNGWPQPYIDTNSHMVVLDWSVRDCGGKNKEPLLQGDDMRTNHTNPLNVFALKEPVVSCPLKRDFGAKPMPSLEQWHTCARMTDQDLQTIARDPTRYLPPRLHVWYLSGQFTNAGALALWDILKFVRHSLVLFTCTHTHFSHDTIQWLCTCLQQTQMFPCLQRSVLVTWKGT